MSVCFNVAVIVGFMFSAINFGTDVVSFTTWGKTYQDYESHADEMVLAIGNDTTSNFQADSTWFVAISAEYEAARDFDRNYVYCDVVTLQSKPDELYDDGSGIWMTMVVFVWLSGGAFLGGWLYLFCLVKTVSREEAEKRRIAEQYGVSHQMETVMRGDGFIIPMPQHKTCDVQKQKREFMRCRAIGMFCAVGPMIAVNWLIVLMRGSTNGYDCHEKFYDCGVAGSCDMGDLMVPVALNSSYLDLVGGNVLMMLAICSGLVDMVWSFAASLTLFVRAADFKFIWLPFMVVVGASLPMVWMLFLDGVILKDLGSDTAILAVGHISIVVMLIYGCIGFCKDDSSPAYNVEKMSPEQIKAMNAKDRSRMKRDCFYLCCCMWCGPCCHPKPRKAKGSQVRKQNV